jgi:hypothetical protein
MPAYAAPGPNTKVLKGSRVTTVKGAFAMAKA